MIKTCSFTAAVAASVWNLTSIIFGPKFINPALINASIAIPNDENKKTSMSLSEKFYSPSQLSDKLSLIIDLQAAEHSHPFKKTVDIELWDIL